MYNHETPVSSELVLPATALDINTVCEAMWLAGVRGDDFEDMRQIMAGPIEADALADISHDLHHLIETRSLGRVGLSKIDYQLEAVAATALSDSREVRRQYLDEANRLAGQRPGQFLIVSDNLNNWGYWFGMSQLDDQMAAGLVVDSQVVYATLTECQLYVDIAKLPPAEQTAVAAYRRIMEF